MGDPGETGTPGEKGMPVCITHSSQSLLFVLIYTDITNI